jgi:transcription factor WhiB
MTRHRQPARPPSAPHPQRAPHLAAGICARYPDPDVWHRTGSRPLALALCARCPVLAPCRAWAATVPPDDPSVLGGTTPADRLATRRARQAALTAALSPPAA